MDSDEFKHESLQDTRSIVQYLQALIDGLQSGTLELSDERAKVVLEPKGLLGLELRAKRKGRRSKFQMKLTWTDAKPATEDSSLKLTPGGSESTSE